MLTYTDSLSWNQCDERAICTVNNNLLAGLASDNPTFPIREWFECTIMKQQNTLQIS